MSHLGLVAVDLSDPDLVSGVVRQSDPGFCEARGAESVVVRQALGEFAGWVFLCTLGVLVLLLPILGMMRLCLGLSRDPWRLVRLRNVMQGVQRSVSYY